MKASFCRPGFRVRPSASIHSTFASFARRNTASMFSSVSAIQGMRGMAQMPVWMPASASVLRVSNLSVVLLALGSNIFWISSEGDLLSQWRGYASNGSGLSIGFNSDLLPNSKSMPHHTAAKGKNITTLRCVYNEKEQNEAIETIVLSCLAAMQHGDFMKSDITINAAYNINGLGTIFKNESFYEEKEWRIIHTPMIMGNKETNETTIHNGISKLKHRISNGRLISYFEYDFKEFIREGIISDLILGPKCNITNYDLELFLTLNGLPKLKYRRSKLTYR